MKHLICQCSRHCRDSAESTATCRNSTQICRPLRPRGVFTRHAVRSVCFTQRVWSALWARPRDDASSVAGLDLSHAFFDDVYYANALNNSSTVSFFCSLTTHFNSCWFVWFSAWLSAPLISFSCLVEARGPSSVVLTVAWISFAARNGYYLAVSVCWNQSSTTNRGVKPNISSFDLSYMFGQGARRGVKHRFTSMCQQVAHVRSDYRKITDLGFQSCIGALRSPGRAENTR